jgi:hypothetical protein
MNNTCLWQVFGKCNFKRISKKPKNNPLRGATKHEEKFIFLPSLNFDFLEFTRSCHVYVHT